MNDPYQVLGVSRGASEEEIKKIKETYSLSTQRDDFLYSNYLKVHSFFVAAGYTDEQVKMMISSFPPICSYSVESLKSKINWFREKHTCRLSSHRTCTI